ncbi:MAG: GAF domain-containing protein [Pyrinomonadaceae bacterium]
MERQVNFEVIQGINTTANLDQLLELIHNSLRQVVSARELLIALYDRATEQLHSQFFRDQYDEPHGPQALSKGCTAYVFRTGQPVLMTDEMLRALTERGEVEDAGTPPAAWLGVPLKTPSEMIGVLVVQHYENPHAYSQRDVEFLISIGGQIALAIERKQAEEKLKNFAAKLERSNRELQEFASVASHDLQEPLRKIQAFGDRLKAKCGESLGEAGTDYLERMQSAAVRMQALITDLLTFSRVTTKGRSFSPVNLGDVAREVVSDLEVRLEQSGGQVELHEMMTIDADPLQMRQLLQNLIGNALKFYAAGIAPVVRVTCAREKLGRRRFGLRFERRR